VNHHLRGAASTADEEWIRAFCDDLDVPLSVLDGTLDPDQVRERGLEAAARHTRYRLLAEERGERQADYVATAHTRSDQAETVLIRLLTGRGSWRLSGIVPVTDDGLIRPLIRLPRAEVIRYLSEHGIEPRLDSSNQDTRFLRNRVRHELLPLIEDWNPRIEELLADTASMELERAAAFDQLLEPVRRDLVTRDGSTIMVLTPSDMSPHVLRMLLLEEIRRLDPDTREVDAASLGSLLDSEPGTCLTLSPRLRADRDTDGIRLRSVAGRSPFTPWSFSIHVGERISIAEAGYEITLREARTETETVSGDRLCQLIQVPSSKDVRFEIRSRLPGDRFRPLGMNRDKNLADFLIDRRIPVEERDSLPLLVCNGSIVWITGVEVGDAFKVTPTPGRRLEIVAKRLEEVT